MNLRLSRAFWRLRRLPADSRTRARGLGPMLPLMAFACSAWGSPVFRPDDQDQILLDKEPWRFKLDNAVREGVGLKEGWHLAGHDDGDWKTIPVGVSWESQGYDYNGFAWYRCRFFLPESWKGKTVLFDLGRPDDRGKVYINGKQVAHIPEYGPHFSFSLAGEPLRYGAENVVAVQISDWYMYGGLNEGTFRIQLHQDVFQPESENRIPLDGARWRFKRDNAVRDGVGLKEGWQLPDHDDDKWNLIRVGVNWEKEGFDYNGVAWYRCRFFLPESWKEDALIFDLGRPDDRGTAFLNGEKMADIPEYGPHFAFTVQGAPLRYGAENVIAVRLSDWYMYGGLNDGKFQIRRLRPFSQQPGKAMENRPLSVTSALKDKVFDDPAWRHGWRDEGTSDTRPRYSVARGALDGEDALAMNVWYPNSDETLDYRLPKGERGSDWARDGFDFISFLCRSDDTEGEMALRLNQGDNRWKKGARSYWRGFTVRPGGWRQVVLPFTSFRGNVALATPAGLDTLALAVANNRLRRPGTILFSRFEVGRFRIPDAARPIPLVEPWRFKTDPVNPDGTPVKRGGAPGAEGAGLAQGWHKESFDDSTWKVVRAGLEWERQGYNYDGACWYRQKVMVPAEWKNLPLRLQLGQPDDRGELYWNGTEIQKISSYGPYFSVVIPPESVRYGGLNTIAVRVVDWYMQGGLTKGPFSLSLLTDGEILVRRAGETKAVPPAEFEMGPRPDGKDLEIVISLPGILTDKRGTLAVRVTDCFSREIADCAVPLVRTGDRLEGVLRLNAGQALRLFYGEQMNLQGLVSDAAGHPITGIAHYGLKFRYETRDGLTLPPLPDTVEETPYGPLRLVDVIDCAADPASGPHPYKEGGIRASWVGRKAYASWINGVTVQEFKGRKYREANNNEWFGYRVGRGKLAPHRAYLLRVEYPEDKSRYFPVNLDTGRNYSGKGFKTGLTIAPVGKTYPLSGGFEWYDQLIVLDEKDYGYRGSRSAPSENGTWVFFHDIGRCYAGQYDAGPAATQIRLYEIADIAKFYPAIAYPEGQPRRVMMMDWERQPEAPPADVAHYCRFLGFNAVAPLILKWGNAAYWPTKLGYERHDPAVMFKAMPAGKELDTWKAYLDAARDADLGILPRLEYGGSTRLPKEAYAKKPDGGNAPVGRYASWGPNLLHPATWEEFAALLDETVGGYYRDYPQLMGVLWRMRSERVCMSKGPNDIARYKQETGALDLDGYEDWWHGKRRDFHMMIRDKLRSYRPDMKLYYYNWDPDGWSLGGYNMTPPDWSDFYNVHKARAYHERVLQAALRRKPGDYLNMFKAKTGHNRAMMELYRDVDGIAFFAPIHGRHLSDNQSYVEYFRTGDGLAMCNMFNYEEKGRQNVQGDIYETSEMTPGGPRFAMADEVYACFHGDPNVITCTTYTYGRGFVAEHRRFAQAFLALPATPGTLVPHPNSDVRVRTYPAGDGRVYVGVVHRGFQPATITVTVPGVRKEAVVKDLVTGKTVASDFAGGSLSFTVQSDAMQLNSFVVTPRR
ncbi:MAG: hypothetical protein GX615_12625 [Lentisphaerae bacterium]|nr:hypothetical protein [Lentisphaerota bacterium]